MLLLGALVLLGSSSCDSKTRVQDSSAAQLDDRNVGEDSSTPDGPPEPPEDPASPEVADLERFTRDLEGDGKLVTVIETSLGHIECELFEERAPRAVANFVGLSRGLKSWRDPDTGEIVEGRSFYEGVAFHYVVPGHFVQAGDRTGTGRGGPGYTFDDEIDSALSHDRAGTLSMANVGPDTNGSQFFITERPSVHLDGRHTIFGRCSDLDVVEAIGRSPTDLADQPESPPRIRSIRFSRAR